MPAKGSNHKKSHRTEFNRRMGRWICGCGWKGKRINSRKAAGNRTRSKDRIRESKHPDLPLQSRELERKVERYQELPVFLVLGLGTS